jgi:hypothetical protein
MDSRKQVGPQASFDPSIYSMESFDPSGINEEFDPSDNEDDDAKSQTSRARSYTDREELKILKVYIRFKNGYTESNILSTW